MNHAMTNEEIELVRERNVLAAISSVIPGLGHIYKGHFAAGLLVMFLGVPLAVWTGVLLSLATAGIGFFFPIICWGAVAVDAYYESDRSRHAMGVL